MIVPEELRTPKILKRDAPYDLNTLPEPTRLSSLLRHIRKTRQVLRKVIDKEGTTALADFFDALDATLELEQRYAQALLAAVEVGDSDSAARHARGLREASALALPLSYTDFTLRGVVKGRRAKA